jgi:2-hydroxymethylglutarate dehydrogenase
MNVGFIGIGNMGRIMAQHVLEAGYVLTVHDTRKETAQHLLKNGARWMDTPKGVAKSCQVVLSCLPGPPDVEEVVYGTDGLMAGWKEGDIYIDMSTNSPSIIRRVAEIAKTKGVSVLDTPVSGGVAGAKAGTLAIMVGGDPHTLEKVHKILAVIGSKIVHVGDIGCGNIAKLVNNMISICCNAACAEGFVLGVKAGIDPEKLYQVISAGTANNWNLQQYPDTVFIDDFEPGFKLDLAYKDIQLALALSSEYRVLTPLALAAQQGLIEARAAGLGDKSVQSVIMALEKIAGVQVRTLKR